MFAGIQIYLTNLLAPAGFMGYFAIAALSIVPPLCVFAFSPWIELPRLPSFLETPLDNTHAGDFLISAYDIAKYTHNELILRLDKYLGGGITAMQYYEDIVGQIVISARIAARKQRVFRAACVITALAQLCLTAKLIYK